MDAQLIIAITALAFISTNLDNLGLIIVLIAGKGFSAGDVMRGYLLSLLVVIALVWGLATLVELGPADKLGYLGLLPIGFGIYKWFRAYRPAKAATRERPTAAGMVGVAMVMLAQSIDSMAVYLALLADTADGLEPVVVLTLIVCGVVWITAARWLASSRLLSEPLEQWGRFLLPVVLIAVGAYILLDTPTDAI